MTLQEPSFSSTKTVVPNLKFLPPKGQINSLKVEQGDPFPVLQ